jgi:hypothetical protein
MNERDRAITGCIATHTKLSNDIVEPTTTAFMPNLKRLIYDLFMPYLISPFDCPILIMSTFFPKRRNYTNIRSNTLLTKSERKQMNLMAFCRFNLLSTKNTQPFDKVP